MEMNYGNALKIEEQRASKNNFHVKRTILSTFISIFSLSLSFGSTKRFVEAATRLCTVFCCAPSGRPRLSSSFGTSPCGRTPGRLFFNLWRLQHDRVVLVLLAIPIQVNRLDASSRTEGGWDMIETCYMFLSEWKLHDTWAGLNQSPCSCLFWAV